jgi:predicted secreted protein
MTTQGLIGYGITVARGDGASPEVFTKIAELIDLSPPSLAKDSVEMTHTDSPDGFREFIPGLKDGGEFTATVNLVPGAATQHNASGGALNDYINETTARNWRITFPGSPAATWTFKAFITSFEAATPMDDKMTFAITFKVTGAPTIA